MALMNVNPNLEYIIPESRALNGGAIVAFFHSLRPTPFVYRSLFGRSPVNEKMYIFAVTCPLFIKL